MNSSKVVTSVVVLLLVVAVCRIDGCSPVLSCSQIQALAQANFPSQYVNDMICIAYYESSWCSSAYNGICCYGLWQINENHLGEQGCPSTTEELLNPTVNAQCAAQILSSQGLNAWQTWSEGKCNGWNKCTSSTSGASSSSSSGGNSKSSGGASKSSGGSNSGSSSSSSSSSSSGSTGSSGGSSSGSSSSGSSGTGATGSGSNGSSGGSGNGPAGSGGSGGNASGSSGGRGCVMDRKAETVDDFERLAMQQQE